MKTPKIFSILLAAFLFTLAACTSKKAAASEQPGDSQNEPGDTFTDARDGKSYRTVKIGDDTWMAQNLGVETANSWCYGDDASNCEIYGRLYDWAAAMNACPSGWRLPDCVDWNNLAEAAGGPDAAGKKLKSQTGWNMDMRRDGTSRDGNGTDDFGFSALPGGGREHNGKFSYAGSYGVWWSATETGRGVIGSIAWDKNMGKDSEKLYEYGIGRNSAVSVRCVRGVQETRSTNCFSSAKASISETAENVLADFSFEDGGKSWQIWGGGVSNAARSGKAGVTIRNEKIEWNAAEQTVAAPQGAATVTLSGWMKTEGVIQGVESWEAARISIEFLDELGKMIGGYQMPAGQTVGTTDWTYYTRDYKLSSNTPTHAIRVQLALGNALGTVHFDDITLTIKNSGGEYLKPSRLSGIMDEGEWYPLDKKTSSTGSHYVDWSSLLDAPAGKHGFLKVKDGEFVLENGKKMRFWGTNIVGKDCFASNAVIDSTVSRLAKMGVNMLRMHHLDAPWAVPNIFGNTEKTTGTRALSKESMRQLDYFIYRAKQKGIYIFLDLLVHRDFTEADGIKNRPPDIGGKQVAFFSEKIIELQKEYNENVLNHVNQFTGVAYKDEPAIALSGIINESTIFGSFDGDILTPPYREELTGLWEKSEFGTAGSTDKKLAVFALDWEDDRPKLRLFAKGNTHESIKFLSGTETAYFKNMERHLRKSGARMPISGSNMPMFILAMLRNNSVLDFTMSNIYWDHPQMHKMNSDWNRTLEAPFHNGSQLKDPKLNSIQNKSYFRIDGKPYIITEWNHCYPNEHVLEGVPLMAAYAALQGWNGALQFDFNGYSHDSDALGIGRLRSYTFAVQPEHVAHWVMGAPLFLRGDVKAAPGLIVEGIGKEQHENLPNHSNMLDENYHLPFITRVAKSFDGKSKGDIGKYAKYFSPDSGIIRSETGELLLNSKRGYMRIETARIQGASGFIGGVPFDFPLFSGEISNRHASVYAVSADGAALTSSKRFYMVVTGPAKMKGQVYDPARTQLENAGNDEVLAQVVNGKITFKKVGGKRVQVFPLEINGERGKPMELEKAKGSAGTLDLGKGRTLVYEVVVVQ